MKFEGAIPLVTGANRGIGRSPLARLIGSPATRTACLLAVGLLGASCGANDRDASELSGQVAALAANVDQSGMELSDLNSKLRGAQTELANDGIELRRLMALASITAIAGCYGRGHDAVVPGSDADQSEALTILQSCFADDVQSEFRYFGNPARASDKLAGIAALVEYIAAFWASAGYHSARNVPGNVHVEMVDAKHAKLLYSGTTPHFSLAADDADPDPKVVSRPGFIDNISASYASEIELQDDGVWRTTRFIIDIKEVIRVNGTYWIGQ